MSASSFRFRVRRWLRSFLYLAIFASAAPALAQVERLDDSTSPRARVQAELLMESDHSLHGMRLPASPWATVRFHGVEYRLATAQYVGRRARISFVLPPFITGLGSSAGMRVQWTSSGLFAPGAASPGERTLVWNGIVPGPWMSERFDLNVRFDLRQLQRIPGPAIDFEAYFEIEVLP